MTVFEPTIILRHSHTPLHSDIRLLDYLSALTFDFDRSGRTTSAVLIYAEPSPENEGEYRAVTAHETGFEGIACLDDTARAALLALAVYEHSGSRKALALARRWLTFVEYMQYADGSFANFVRNAAGLRNASGQTSVRGGYWWSSRALWALARAYRLTGEGRFRERYEACKLDEIEDGKINAILALSKLELYEASKETGLMTAVLGHCETIVGDDSALYFLDHPGDERVHLWGYHQLHAVASAALVFQDSRLLEPCRRTVRHLVQPDVNARFWHSFPDRQKSGVCAYDVAPIVQGLAAMHRVTGSEHYRKLAVQGAAWFYGRNDARTPMYDPTTGTCRDGITDGIASQNHGAESTIEAGFAEMERRTLTARV